MEKGPTVNFVIKFRKLGSEDNDEYPGIQLFAFNESAYVTSFSDFRKHSGSIFGGAIVWEPVEDGKFIIKISVDSLPAECKMIPILIRVSTAYAIPQFAGSMTYTFSASGMDSSVHVDSVDLTVQGSNVDWFVSGVLSIDRDPTDGIPTRVLFRDISSFPENRGDVVNQLKDLVHTLLSEISLTNFPTNTEDGWYVFDTIRAAEIVTSPAPVESPMNTTAFLLKDTPKSPYSVIESPYVKLMMPTAATAAPSTMSFGEVRNPSEWVLPASTASPYKPISSPIVSAPTRLSAVTTSPTIRNLPVQSPITAAIAVATRRSSSSTFVDMQTFKTAETSEDDHSVPSESESVPRSVAGGPRGPVVPSPRIAGLQTEEPVARESSVVPIVDTLESRRPSLQSDTVHQAGREESQGKLVDILMSPPTPPSQQQPKLVPTSPAPASQPSIPASQPYVRQAMKPESEPLTRAPPQAPRQGPPRVPHQGPPEIPHQGHPHVPGQAAPQQRPSVLQEFSHLSDLMRRGKPVHSTCQECRIKDQEMRWLKARIAQVESEVAMSPTSKGDDDRLLELQATIESLIKEKNQLEENCDFLNQKLRVSEKIIDTYKSATAGAASDDVFDLGVPATEEVPDFVLHPNRTMNVHDSMASQLRFQEDIVVSLKDQIMRLGNQLKLGRQFRGISSSSIGN